MRISYCDECRQIFAAGPLPGSSASHRFVAGKGDSANVIDHATRILDVPDAPPLPGEKAGKYLARLVRVYAGKLG